MLRSRLNALAALACVTLSAGAAAQMVGGAQLPDIDWVQRYGETVPLDTRFIDEEGREVALGDVVDGRPVVLALVYYECPMLCNLVLEGLVRSLKAVPFDVGDDFVVIVISIDPDETPELARERKQALSARYGRAGTGDGWHLFVGSESEIERVAEAVGFGYEYVPQSGEYAHAAGITVLTAEGVISRYFYGHEYAPRDVRLGLVEAGEGTVGSPIDVFLLRCFLYDPANGKYGFAIMRAARIGGIGTFLILSVFIIRMLIRERRTGATRTLQTSAEEGV